MTDSAATFSGFSWSWADEWIDRTPEMSGDERTEGHAAVRYFRSLLGEDWQERATGRPLATRFVCSFCGEPLECIRLHRLLKSLEGMVNLDLIIHDLAGPRWENFLSATQMITFASALFRSGHQTEFIRPTPGLGQRPDLRTWLVDRWVNVECTVLHEPQAVQDSHALERDLNKWFAEAQFAGAGVVTVEFEEITIDEAKRGLEGLKASMMRLARQGIQGSEHLPGYATAKFRPGSDGFWPVRVTRGPVVERYSTINERTDAKRIQGRIPEKARQLAGGGPTLLLIQNNALFCGLDDQDPHHTARLVAASISNGLGRSPAISAVLDYEEWSQQGSEGVRRFDGQSFRAAVGSHDGLNHYFAVLVTNPAGSCPLTNLECEALMNLMPQAAKTPTAE